MEILFGIIALAAVAVVVVAFPGVLAERRAWRRRRARAVIVGRVLVHIVLETEKFNAALLAMSEQLNRLADAVRVGNLNSKDPV